MIYQKQHTRQVSQANVRIITPGDAVTTVNTFVEAVLDTDTLIA